MDAPYAFRCSSTPSNDARGARWYASPQTWGGVIASDLRAADALRPSTTRPGALARREPVKTCHRPWARARACVAFGKSVSAIQIWAARRLGPASSAHVRHHPRLRATRP